MLIKWYECYHVLRFLLWSMFYEVRCVLPCFMISFIKNMMCVNDVTWCYDVWCMRDLIYAWCGSFVKKSMMVTPKPKFSWNLLSLWMLNGLVIIMMLGSRNPTFLSNICLSDCWLAWWHVKSEILFSMRLVWYDSCMMLMRSWLLLLNLVTWD